MNHDNQISPVFIVSSGRSGTTLLRSILNASDRIYILPESDFIARTYSLYGDRQSFTGEDYEKIAKLFAKTSENNGWNLPQPYLISYLKDKNPQSFAEVNSYLYEAYIKHKNIESVAWGIKTPVLIAHLDLILKVFPKAKIVHLVRDGRDVYLSYQKVHQNSPVKFGPKGILTMSLYWVDGLRRLASIDRAKVYECRYEDLLDSPEKTLKNLCSFLNIEYKRSMYEDYQNAPRNQELLWQDFQKVIHAKIEKGIDPSNQKKYLKEMSKRDRLIFELLTAPYLAKYQYSLELPATNSPFFSPLRGLLYFGARQYNNWRYRQRDRRAINKIKS
jgi:hypothetical protein